MKNITIHAKLYVTHVLTYINVISGESKRGNRVNTTPLSYFFAYSPPPGIISGSTTERNIKMYYFFNDKLRL